MTRSFGLPAGAGDVSQAEVDALDAATAKKAANLSDLASAAAARTNLGLGNVTNTSDANKPVSTAQQAALDLKAPIASPTFTGTVAGITKAMVGLGNVDNTSDANKPVSTAQAAADALKVAKAGDTMTGRLTMGTMTGSAVTINNQAADGIGFSVSLLDANRVGFYTITGADGFERFAVTAGGVMTWGSGAASVDTTLYRSAANVLATDDDLAIAVAGKGLRVKEGSNAKMGVATLVAGTVTVSTTAVTANSRIFLTVQSLGTVTAPKAVAVTGRTAATSFTITSADATDTSVVAWHLIEPA